MRSIRMAGLEDASRKLNDLDVRRSLRYIFNKANKDKPGEPEEPDEPHEAGAVGGTAGGTAGGASGGASGESVESDEPVNVIETIVNLRYWPHGLTIPGLTHKQSWDIQRTIFFLERMNEAVEELRIEVENWRADWGCSGPVEPFNPLQLGLRYFEKIRNVAAKHCESKAECYQQVAAAERQGKRDIVLFYTQIAMLHSNELNVAIFRAGNCASDMEYLAKMRETLLDLYYVDEHDVCDILDQFLDHHILALRKERYCNYKNLLIVFNRGPLTIHDMTNTKYLVKRRLKERRLRWKVVDKGLFEVKILCGSRDSAFYSRPLEEIIASRLCLLRLRRN